MTRALVLLSTWNGARYLPAQIESILTQRFDGELAILVRDDGSSDATVAYLNGLADSRIRLIEGVNLGPRGSFFALLRMAREEAADVIALCDQDDVWHPDKLDRALSQLGGEEPALYASSLNLVGEDLSPIRTYRHAGNRTLASTLLQNYVTGCTCVMNRRFLHAMPFPVEDGKVVMHDWWLALVAAIGARVAYDPVSAISYRQHAFNHVGIGTGAVATFRKLRAALTGRAAVTRFDQARQLLAATGDRLDDAQRRQVGELLSGERSRFRRLRFLAGNKTGVGLRPALRFVLFG